MSDHAETLIALERRFWQSLVDQDFQVATEMLAEPAIVVSAQGAMEFDRDAYKQMAEQGSMVVKSFELSNVNVTFANDATAIVTYRAKQGVAERGGSHSVTQDMIDSSIWVRDGRDWKCVMHTETPAADETQ